jgi:hypothetical protein
MSSISACGRDNSSRASSSAVTRRCSRSGRAGVSAGGNFSSIPCRLAIAVYCSANRAGQGLGAHLQRRC